MNIYLTFAILCVLGLLVDGIFIRTELAGNMKAATLYKGLASLEFVLLGINCYINKPSSYGVLILIGLILGLIGDVLLNMRNLYEGAKSNKVFAVGILAFLSGHFLYIAALIACKGITAAIAAPVAIAIFLVSVPKLMDKIQAPSKGLKIFGYVYLAIVIYMFSCAAVLLFTWQFNARTVLFAIGGLLFMVSDFIMIYYSFGKKLPKLRVTNLLLYYIGQLMIALTIYFL